MVICPHQPRFILLSIFQSMGILPPARQLGEDVGKPPKYAGRLALAFWRLQLWFECTFGLTVMEPWERMVVRAFCFSLSGPFPNFFILVTFFAVVSSLVCTGLVRFFPQKLVGLQRRTVYYLWGHPEEVSATHMHLS